MGLWASIVNFFKTLFGGKLYSSTEAMRYLKDSPDFSELKKKYKDLRRYIDQSIKEKKRGLYKSEIDDIAQRFSGKVVALNKFSEEDNKKNLVSIQEGKTRRIVVKTLKEILALMGQNLPKREEIVKLEELRLKMYKPVANLVGEVKYAKKNNVRMVYPEEDMREYAQVLRSIRGVIAGRVKRGMLQVVLQKALDRREVKIRTEKRKVRKEEIKRTKKDRRAA